MKFEPFRILLSERRDEYIKQHPKTADNDLQIIENLLSGKEVKQVAPMFYYEISSIYRIIRRIKKFLSEIPEEELNLDDVSGYFPASVSSWPTKGFSMVGFRVFDTLIGLCQLRRSSIGGAKLAQAYPSLRYVQRRSQILDQLRSFELILRNENNKHVQVFEYIEYTKHYYVFRLTKEAASYLGL